MVSSLVITLREGLEAVLVIAIILSFLKRTGMEELGRFVWYGVLAASLLCITAGSLLFSLAGSLSDEAGEVFEITVTFMAAGMLTFMIVWMKRHGRELKSGMEMKARRASRSASPVAISLLAFATVGREGLEILRYHRHPFDDLRGGDHRQRRPRNRVIRDPAGSSIGAGMEYRRFAQPSGWFRGRAAFIVWLQGRPRTASGDIILAVSWNHDLGLFQATPGLVAVRPWLAWSRVMKENA